MQGGTEGLLNPGGADASGNGASAWRWGRVVESAATGMAYRADIDGLRAVAVLAVVLYHAFPRLLPGGFIGVDIFFVISGYLITGILLAESVDGRLNLARFYARRIRRIFPALLVVLAACLAAGWRYMLPEEYQQLGMHTAAGAGFMSNLLLWKEAGYFDRIAETKPLLHLWSLGVEEQFYLLWPLLVWLGMRRAGALAWLGACLVLASFGYGLFLLRENPVAAFYSPLSRFWELGIGAELAIWMQQRHRTAGGGQPVRWFPGSAGLPLIAAGLLAIRANHDFPGAWALLPALGTGCLIAAGPSSWGNRWLARPPLVALGKISFPLYLWHWPLLVFARLLGDGAPAWPANCAVLVLALFLSVVTYRWVERPLRFLLPARRAVPALCLGMAGLTLGALYLYDLEGVPGRLPAGAEGGLFVRQSLGDWMIRVRDGTCNVTNLKPRPADCIDARRPLVFLWGDSHAAALYPGLRKLQETRDFGIAQFTQAACPPLLEFTTPARRVCPELNQAAIEAIARTHPATVLLAAHWRNEDYAPLYDPATRRFDAARLLPTLRRLRGLGVTNIVLVGPAPVWKDELWRIVLMQYLRDPMHRAPPLYMRAPLADGMPEIDASLRQLAAREGLRYVAPADTLCGEAGCLTRLPGGGNALTTPDFHHLSMAAAVQVVRLWADALLKP